MINPNKFANQKMQEFGQTAFDIQQFEENNMQMRQGVNKIQSLDSPVPPPGSIPESPYGDITVNPIMQQDLKKLQPQPPQPQPKVVRERERIVLPTPPQKEQQREKIPLNVNLDPNKYKYKKGELLDAQDFSEMSGQIDLAAEKYSDIQEDEKGQYVTSLGEGEYFKHSYDKNFKRPTSSRHIDKWSEKEVERDTIRPRSGKAFISTWKKK